MNQMPPSTISSRPPPDTRTESDLAESVLPEQVFNGFLEAAPDAVVIANREGRILRVNSKMEKLFGYPRVELLGRELELLLPERFRERHVAQRTSYFDQPSSRPIGAGLELYGLRKDGKEFPVEISLSPLPTATGFVVASAIRDITAHRLLEEKLRQRTSELQEADRHKDEFLGILAHELRNPLGTIRNAVQILQVISSCDSNLNWARDVICRQTEHMKRLIDDLLDSTRIGHGKLSIQKGIVELKQVIAQAVETCRSLVDARKQQLTVSLPSKPLHLFADPTRLVQVLTNLLHNAATYTDVGGQISLKAEEEAGQVVVKVRDNGIGISGEMLPRVFDLFTQIPGVLDRTDGGLGIGLAMVGHLVQLHGGTVQAFSDGVGRGSEFVVRLPLRSEITSGRDFAEKPDRSETLQSAPHPVLAAEDDGTLTEAFAQILRQQGRDVSTPDSGSDVLNTAPAFKLDVPTQKTKSPIADGDDFGTCSLGAVGKLDPFQRTVAMNLRGFPKEVSHAYP